MMTGLFDPKRHEPLQAAPWDEAAALEAIRRIADSALDGLRARLGLARASARRSRAAERPVLQPVFRRRRGDLGAALSRAGPGRSTGCPISRPSSPCCVKPTGRSSPTANTAALHSCSVMPGSICCTGPSSPMKRWASVVRHRARKPAQPCARGAVGQPRHGAGRHPHGRGHRRGSLGRTRARGGRRAAGRDGNRCRHRHLAMGAEPVRPPAGTLYRRRPWFCRQRLPLLARRRRCCPPIKWR